MATINLTVPDAKAGKVYDAFKRAYGDSTVNPTNADKLAFVKGKLLDYIKEIVFADERNQATKTAGDAVIKDDGVAS